MDWLEKGDKDMKTNDDEGIRTYSSAEQDGVEHSVMKKFKDFEEFSDVEPEVLLSKCQHVPYLLKGLERLSQSYECLDASRPWICYWIVHSLKLLNEPIDDDMISRVSKFLGKCQSPTGGFGGGPGQLAHLAPTYAAVNCLASLETEEAYSVIDRNKLLEFLWKMRQDDGSFTMHEGGEADTRSVYCAASVAALTGLLDEDVELFDNSVGWLVRCQTYEGGMGGCPGAEAHGGYTFCGYAALAILGHCKLVDTDRLLRWVVNKQMKLEGGFQGRTNKLVDACYSFWQGGLLPLIQNTLEAEGGSDASVAEDQESWLYDQQALQAYVLICCQSSFGGMVDKPGKSPDYYHTCYALSGLSSSQHCPNGNVEHVGPKTNVLTPAHPAFNVTGEAVKRAVRHFNQLRLEQGKAA